MIPRILVDSAELGETSGHPIVLPLGRDQSHYLTRVLRLQGGASVQVTDGRGHRWAARLDAADAGTWSLRLEQAIEACPESALRITLAQCLSSADKMDWTVEKAVELGATAIAPPDSARSQIRLDASRAARKHAHWRRIVEAACLQSGRDHLPTVHATQALGPWLEQGWTGEPLRLVLDPLADQALTACADLVRHSTGGIALLVGPESGLAPEEIDAAVRAGFRRVRLGSRILRTETAGLAALAALQALAGDF